MADLTQTAGSVLDAAGALLEYGTAGGALTRGQPYYKDAGDNNKWKPAINDAAPHAEAAGICLVDVASGQKAIGCVKGDINLGATLVVGEAYCVSNTAGKICPIADIGAGEFQTILGVASSATNLKLNINPGGVAHA